jgi:hypothetical protein
MRRLRRAARFTWRNLDALLVIVAAGVIVALDLLNRVEPAVVRSATLALLGITAFVLLRDRSERAVLLDFRRRADRALGDLQALSKVANDALSELPYEVLTQTCEWDILSRDQSVATSTVRLRFTRGAISTLESWCGGTGELLDWSAWWKYPDDSQWNKAEGIHKAEVEGGTKNIFALSREHSRDEVIDWHVRREARGRFPTRSESVSIRPLVPNVDHPRQMRLFWPAGIPPMSVSLRYGNQKGISLKPLFNGDPVPRAYVAADLQELSRYGIAEIAWTW